MDTSPTDLLLVLRQLGDDAAPDAVLAAMRDLADRLNGADPLSREAVRAGALPILRHYGWRASALDALIRPPTAGDTRQGRALVLEDAEPWPTEVVGIDLLDDLVRTYRRFVVVASAAVADAFALYALHTHAHDAAETSPILAFTSPDKRCGKTTSIAVAGRGRTPPAGGREHKPRSTLPPD